MSSFLTVSGEQQIRKNIYSFSKNVLDLSPLVKVFLIGTSRFSVGIRGFPTYKVIQKLNFDTFSFPNFRIAFLIPNQALKQYLVNRKNYAKKTNKTLKKQILHFPSPGLLSVTAPILTRAETKFLPFCCFHNKTNSSYP